MTNYEPFRTELQRPSGWSKCGRTDDYASKIIHANGLRVAVSVSAGPRKHIWSRPSNYEATCTIKQGDYGDYLVQGVSVRAKTRWQAAGRALVQALDKMEATKS